MNRLYVSEREPADKRQADKGKGVWHGDKGKEGGAREQGDKGKGCGIGARGRRVGPVDKREVVCLWLEAVLYTAYHMMLTSVSCSAPDSSSQGQHTSQQHAELLTTREEKSYSQFGLCRYTSGITSLS